MQNTYSQIYIQIVFAVKGRENFPPALARRVCPQAWDPSAWVSRPPVQPACPRAFPPPVSSRETSHPRAWSRQVSRQVLHPQARAAHRSGRAAFPRVSFPASRRRWRELPASRHPFSVAWTGTGESERAVFQFST